MTTDIPPALPTYVGDLDAYDPEDYKRPGYLDDLLDRTDERH